jgi:hypothetical protein
VCVYICVCVGVCVFGYVLMYVFVCFLLCGCGFSLAIYFSLTYYCKTYFFLFLCVSTAEKKHTVPQAHTHKNIFYTCNVCPELLVPEFSKYTYYILEFFYKLSPNYIKCYEA